MSALAVVLQVGHEGARMGDVTLGPLATEYPGPVMGSGPESAREWEDRRVGG